jgi:hypothetical protein
MKRPDRKRWGLFKARALQLHLGHARLLRCGDGWELHVDPWRIFRGKLRELLDLALLTLESRS